MASAGLRTGAVLASAGVIAALMVVSGFASQPSQAPVVLAHLDGAVDPVTAGYLHRVMAAADQEHAALVVLTIDTPGGLDSSMREMVQDMLASHVPSVVFVWPSGARDASAGVFITEAAGLVAMAPGTNIGAAHPVGGGGETITGDLGDKITNDAAAYIAALAKQHGRNDAWVQDAVRKSVSLDAQQAVDQHVADLLAPDLPTLLAMVEGRTVQIAAGETTTIHAAGAAVETMGMQPVELLLQKLFDPNVAYLLLTIGFYALLIELFHPGALVPGVTGGVCLVLAFAASAVLPMNWGGALLILLAVGLFILDIKAAAHGALTVAGMIAFVVGSLLLYSPPGPRSPTLPGRGRRDALACRHGSDGGSGQRIDRRRGRAPADTSGDDHRDRAADRRGRGRPVNSGPERHGAPGWAALVSACRRPGRRTGDPVRVVSRQGLTLHVERADGFEATVRPLTAES